MDIAYVTFCWVKVVLLINEILESHRLTGHFVSCQIVSQNSYFVPQKSQFDHISSIYFLNVLMLSDYRVAIGTYRNRREYFQNY